MLTTLQLSPLCTVTSTDGNKTCISYIGRKCYSQSHTVWIDKYCVCWGHVRGMQEIIG
jgi:hypothetical protein